MASRLVTIGEEEAEAHPGVACWWATQRSTNATLAPFTNLRSACILQLLDRAVLRLPNHQAPGGFNQLTSHPTGAVLADRALIALVTGGVLA